MAKRKSNKVKTPERGIPALPFSLKGRFDYIQKAIVAVRDMGGAFVCLSYSFVEGLVEDLWVSKSEVDTDHAGRRKYYVDGWHVNGGPAQIVKTHAQWLKIQALRCGATPDAIRLFSEVMTITRKEEAEMAAKEKLAKKTKADAPVGKGGKVAKEKGARKGNSDALEKARATRAANAGAPDVRKIKVINKENPYREGSGRASSFDALKGAKTVEDYKTAGGKVKYLSRWESEGRISLG